MQNNFIIRLVYNKFHTLHRRRCLPSLPLKESRFAQRYAWAREPLPLVDGWPCPSGLDREKWFYDSVAVLNWNSWSVNCGVCSRSSPIVLDFHDSESPKRFFRGDTVLSAGSSGKAFSWLHFVIVPWGRGRSVGHGLTLEDLFISACPCVTWHFSTLPLPGPPRRRGFVMEKCIFIIEKSNFFTTTFGWQWWSLNMIHIRDSHFYSMSLNRIE